LLWVLIIGLAAWNMTRFGQIADTISIPQGDFLRYWAAGRVLLQGGNPYGAQSMLQIEQGLGWQESEPRMMWNPPWTLPFLLPFALMPFWVSRAVWFLISVIILASYAGILWQRYGGSTNRTWIAGLGAFAFVPSVSALVGGQISPLVLAGLGGFLWAIEREHFLLAGVFTVLIAVKPHLLYLFWVFLLLWIFEQRRLRILYSAAITLLLSSALVLCVNPRILYTYFEAARTQSSLLDWQTPTWGVVLHMISPWQPSWLRFAQSGIGIVVAVYLWRCWRRDFSWYRHLTPISFLSVVTSSYTWTYDWIVLLPATIALLAWFEAGPALNWWVPVGLVLLQALIIMVQLWLTHPNDFYNVWFPPALWLLYYYGHRMNHWRGVRRQSGDYHGLG
jgi:hypothetical protein